MVRIKHFAFLFFSSAVRVSDFAEEPLNIFHSAPYYCAECVLCYWRSNQWNFFSLPSYGGLWLLNSSIKELYYISGSRGFVHVSWVYAVEKEEVKKRIQESSLLFENKRKFSSNFLLHPSTFPSFSPDLVCAPSYADVKCFPLPPAPAILLFISDNIIALCVNKKIKLSSLSTEKFFFFHPSSEQWQCKFLFNSSMSKQAKLMIHFH